MDKILFVVNGKFRPAPIDLQWDSVELIHFEKLSNRYKLFAIGPNTALGRGNILNASIKLVSWAKLMNYRFVIFSFPNRKLYWQLLFWRRSTVTIYLRGIPVSYLDKLVLRALILLNYRFLSYGDYLDRFNIEYDRVRPVSIIPNNLEYVVKEKLIVYAGQVIESKGIRLACHLFRNSGLKEKGYSFEVYGLGAIHAELSAEYKEVSWMGRVDNEVIMSALKRAEAAILLTSYPEGFPRFLFEASLSGCVPIMFDFVGNEYYGQHNSIIIKSDISAENFRDLVLDHKISATSIACLARQALLTKYNKTLNDLY